MQDIEKKQYNSGLVNLLAAVGIIAVIGTVCDPGRGDKPKSEPVFKDDKAVVDGRTYQKGQLYSLGDPNTKNQYFYAFDPRAITEFENQDIIGKEQMYNASVFIGIGPHKASLIGRLKTPARVRPLEGPLKGREIYVFTSDLNYIDN